MPFSFFSASVFSPSPIATAWSFPTIAYRAPSWKFGRSGFVSIVMVHQFEICSEDCKSLCGWNARAGFHQGDHLAFILDGGF